jgi:hypothetical protein
METVIFRKWRAYGDVIALFPDQLDGEFCGSYMHVGQHSLCHREFVMGASVPATWGEYRDLARELEAIGYALEVTA